MRIVTDDGIGLEVDTLGSEADRRVRRERPGDIEFAARKWAAVAAVATFLVEQVVRS